jgi:hypothetical protein
MPHSVTVPVPAVGGVHVTVTDVCAGLDTCVTDPEQPLHTLLCASGANEPERVVDPPKDAGAPFSGASKKPSNGFAPPAVANVTVYVCPAVHVELGRPDATSTTETEREAAVAW